MINIPNWPSLTQPDFKCVRPNPMPGSISDFDVEISRFYNRIKNARAQLRRNRDAMRIENAEIRENQRYIKRLQKMMAELARKGKKVDETFQLNIDSANEAIDVSREILDKLPEHRRMWLDLQKKCQAWLTWLRKVRRQGISRKTGKPRKCGFRWTTTSVPCQNPAHFRDKIGWRYCTIRAHRQ